MLPSSDGICHSQDQYGEYKVRQALWRAILEIASLYISACHVASVFISKCADIPFLKQSLAIKFCYRLILFFRGNNGNYLKKKKTKQNLTNVWRKATPIKMIEALNTVDWLLRSQIRKIKMTTPI